jgi:Protein of unknown function (DUF3616)
MTLQPLGHVALHLTNLPTTILAATIGNLSAIALTDHHLWLGSDEGRTLERLTPQPDGSYGDPHSIDLGTLFPELLPDKEIDIEGLAYNNGYLWVVGSHSLKRKKPKGSGANLIVDREVDLVRLATIVAEPNRHFLARIPCVNGQLVGQLVGQLGAEHDDKTAAWLRPKDGVSPLWKALGSDRHLGPILRAGIPGKDNGFDIEGLAVLPGTGSSARILLGLRGPVLRGWSMLIEVDLALKPTEDGEPDRLKLKGYRKYFLDLDGLGVRDLALDPSGSLLILAGPTMVLEGATRLYRIPVPSAPDPWDETWSDRWIDRADIETLGDLPVGHRCDRPEGILLEPAGTILIVHDSPSPDRLQGSQVLADRIAIAPQNLPPKNLV